MTRIEHLLTIVAEEATEIAQRATKALRFTLDEVQPGQDKDNRARLWHEVCDLVAVLELLGMGVLYSERTMRPLIEAKKAKAEDFLILSKSLGALDEPCDIADECAGAGQCHGTLDWCGVCGNVGKTCDDPQCDWHRAPIDDASAT